MMKPLSLLIGIYAANRVLVSGFVAPQRPAHGLANSFALAATSRQDASALVEEALKISSSYGIDSSEARLAWEAVEDVDSSDTR